MNEEAMRRVADAGVRETGCDRASETGIKHKTNGIMPMKIALHCCIPLKMKRYERWRNQVHRIEFLTCEVELDPLYRSTAICSSLNEMQNE